MIDPRIGIAKVHLDHNGGGIFFTESSAIFDCVRKCENLPVSMSSSISQHNARSDLTWPHKIRDNNDKCRKQCTVRNHAPTIIDIYDTEIIHSSYGNNLVAALQKQVLPMVSGYLGRKLILAAIPANALAWTIPFVALAGATAVATAAYSEIKNEKATFQNLSPRFVLLLSQLAQNIYDINTHGLTANETTTSQLGTFLYGAFRETGNYFCKLENSYPSAITSGSVALSGVPYSVLSVMFDNLLGCLHSITGEFEGKDIIWTIINLCVGILIEGIDSVNFETTKCGKVALKASLRKYEDMSSKDFITHLSTSLSRRVPLLSSLTSILNKIDNRPLFQNFALEFLTYILHYFCFGNAFAEGQKRSPPEDELTEIIVHPPFNKLDEVELKRNILDMQSSNFI